jgi:hypothetical protein
MLKRLASLMPNLQLRLRSLGCIINSFRLGRIFMMALITGATAYGFDAHRLQIFLAAMTGALLALALGCRHAVRLRAQTRAGNSAGPVCGGCCTRWRVGLRSSFPEYIRRLPLALKSA